MSTKRLPADDRRAAIIAAVRPLVARKGLSATSTKEMAAAAGVSEALIFRHFPSKQALYDAIVESGAGGDPELEKLLSLPPSTATLVHLIKALVCHFVVKVPNDVEGKRDQHRMLLTSIIDDGEFARLSYDWVQHNAQPLFAASVKAAEAAGDLVPSVVLPENRLWFAEHLGSMFASLQLNENLKVSYAGSHLADQMTWFLLRGIGFTDTAIATLSRKLPTTQGD